MTIIVMGISFIVIWLGTAFFIVRYVKRLKDDLFARFADIEKPSEKKSENIPGENVYNPFDNVKRADSKNLLNFIQEEHPQIIALVLAHLDSDKASVILRNLPLEVQGDVSRRIAVLGQVSSEVTREIEEVLEKKLGTCEEYTEAGGVENIAGILNHVDSDTKNQIIKALEGEDPEIAYKVLKQMGEGDSRIRDWGLDEN